MEYVWGNFKYHRTANHGLCELDDFYEQACGEADAINLRCVPSFAPPACPYVCVLERILYGSIVATVLTARRVYPSVGNLRALCPLPHPDALRRLCSNPTRARRQII